MVSTTSVETWVYELSPLKCQAHSFHSSGWGWNIKPPAWDRTILYLGTLLCPATAGQWEVVEPARSVRPFFSHLYFLFFEWTSYLCWSIDRSCYNLNKHLISTRLTWRSSGSANARTISNSSESDSWSVCASIRVEETAARASQPWDEALKLSGEGRDKAVPVSNSADRFICEPQDCSLCCASATVGPEPWGTWAWMPSLWMNARRDRSVRKGSTSQCSQPALSSTDRACSSPKQATQRTCVSPPVK